MRRLLPLLAVALAASALTALLLLPQPHRLGPRATLRASVVERPGGDEALRIEIADPEAPKFARAAFAGYEYASERELTVRTMFTAAPVGPAVFGAYVVDVPLGELRSLTGDVVCVTVDAAPAKRVVATWDKRTEPIPRIVP